MSSSTTEQDQWLGQAALGHGWAVFRGAAGDSQAHAHLAVQILASQATQRIWTPESDWIETKGAVVNAVQKHWLKPTDGQVTLIYLDPELLVAQKVATPQSAGIRLLSPEDCARLLDLLNAGEPSQAQIEALPNIFMQSAADAVQPGSDNLIAEILRSLPLVLPESLSTQALAQSAGLSISRFQHRFRAHTGLPVRPYLRWRRLLAALSFVAQGQSLTDAALSAGFSDAAHCTRTFRRHFGIAPSALRGIRFKLSVTV